MSWLGDFLTGTPRYQGKNCWQWVQQYERERYRWYGQDIHEVFRAMGPKAAPALIEGFGDKTWHSSEWADILAAIGPGVVPQVVQAFLHHPSLATRRMCGQALEKVGAPALPGLLQALGADSTPASAVPRLLAAGLAANAPPQE